MGFQVIPRRLVTDSTFEVQGVRGPALPLRLLTRQGGGAWDKGDADWEDGGESRQKSQETVGKDGLEAFSSEWTLQPPGELSKRSIDKPRPRRTDFIDWDGARHETVKEIIPRLFSCPELLGWTEGAASPAGKNPQRVLRRTSIRFGFRGR